MAETKRTRSRTWSGVDLWFLLWRAAKAQEGHARRSVAAMGLCLSDFGALVSLLREGPLPVNTLGKKILISSGSITTAVDRLAGQGLVERVNIATDRRARIVHLTDKGEALARSLVEQHERDMEQAFAGLDDGEKNALANALRKLGRGGAQAAPTGGDAPVQPIPEEN